MEGGDLLRRLLLHRDDVNEVSADDVFARVAGNMREFRDGDGRLLGRAALKRWIVPGGSRKEPIIYASALTAGAFRTVEQIDMVGIVLGRPEGAARFAARPLVFDCPEALEAWASEQAELVTRVTDDPVVLVQYAGLIRVLGGDTRGLPIARTRDAIWSFDDIAHARELPEEISLHEDQWGGYYCQDLPENGIAVGSGAFKTLYDLMPAKDPRGRANHPRWTQYWMSLWGAVIEAIAKAWGVPLQEVLEASDIASDRSGGGSIEGLMNVWKMKVDRIRNPRTKGSSISAS